MEFALYSLAEIELNGQHRHLLSLTSSLSSSSNLGLLWGTANSKSLFSGRKRLSGLAQANGLQEPDRKGHVEARSVLGESQALGSLQGVFSSLLGVLV